MKIESAYDIRGRGRVIAVKAERLPMPKVTKIRRVGDDAEWDIGGVELRGQFNPGDIIGVVLSGTGGPGEGESVEFVDPEWTSAIATTVRKISPSAFTSLLVQEGAPISLDVVKGLAFFFTSYAATLQNLTETQNRCKELLEENRRLRGVDNG